MKAIVNTAPGRLEWLDWPLPEPAAGQVRIHTSACGICATDLEMIAGWERTDTPAVPGHEWSGIVEAVGPGVSGQLVGQPCVAENVLTDGGEIGFEHPGGYGQFLITNAANVHPLPAAFDCQPAVLIEPLAVCLRGLTRLGLTDLSRALVIGDGPIGLLMTMLLRQAGVENICVIGGRPARLKLAMQVGAGCAADNGDAAVWESWGQFPNIIEASGTTAGVETALRLAASGGKILVLGDYGAASAGFQWNHVLHRELELIGSNASAGAWPAAVRLATGGQLPLHLLITHRIPVAEFESAFETVRHDPQAVKVVLTWAGI